uniref:Uncharacterized protein n=1 Tax=Oryza glumipatula TaxID=40148 RepID=A0A0E0BTV8_9ORYZ
MSEAGCLYISGALSLWRLVERDYIVGAGELMPVIHELLTGGDIIHKLVQTLSPRSSPYDREIHLEELPPRGLQCIASLLVTFQEYSGMETYERD